MAEHDFDPELTHLIHPDDRLVVVREAPLNAETGVAALVAPVTPTEAHFVRASFGPPPVETAGLPIDVGGAVAERLSLSIDELRELPQHSVTMTMECAGNGRMGLSPLPSGEPWARAAVSTASWTGVPLGLVLDRAGVRDDVVEILVSGHDRGTPEDAPGATAFARALPLDKARDPNVILALEMNGAPLPIEHGAPARLIVPGWYGMASVKWVARIVALTEPFAGWFQTERYVYVEREGDKRPVDVMRVKSLIVAPGDEVYVSRGRVEVWGWAWSGAAPVEAVELSVDGGPWREAELEPPLAPHAWRRFRDVIEVDAGGRHTVRSRARDAAGRVQPDEPRWNRHGYGNNAVVAVPFYVV